MQDLEVKIIELPPFSVASLVRYGPSPEILAITALMTWAEQRGLLSVKPLPRFFGFNNPNPAAGSPNYGYEVWLTVDVGTASDDTVQIKPFSGGKFAVTRVTGVENIFNAWQNLVAWVETSPYKFGENLCLEEHLTFMDLVSDENLVLELYLPVE
jgi:DNA gyrase inhibitor GyrI